MGVCTDTNQIKLKLILIDLYVDFINRPLFATVPYLIICATSLFSLDVKAELNLFKYHHVPKMKLTPPIVQNICRIGQLKIGRKTAQFLILQPMLLLCRHTSAEYATQHFPLFCLRSSYRIRSPLRV